MSEFLKRHAYRGRPSFTDETKQLVEYAATLESRVAFLEGMCERAKKYMEGMADEFLPMPTEEKWLADYQSGMEGKECKTNTPQT
jgi:hypothetical protein